MKKSPHDTGKESHQTIQELQDQIAALQPLARQTEALQEKLARSEEALRLREHALEAISPGLVITATDQPGQPVLYVNPAFERMTGHRAAEVVGRGWDYLGEIDSLYAVPDSLRDALLQNLPWSGEVPYRRGDGKLWWAELALAPVSTKGNQRYCVAVLMDISERKRLEAQLVQSQKMDAIGQLAGGIAHDFNNILSVILGYSELLQAGADLTPCQVLGVAEIRKAAESAVRLTSQLLAFGRTQLLKPTVIDVNAIVSDLDSLLRRLIGEDVELVYRLDPKARHVRADRSQVEQVILNLALNARDAMPRGGQLTIETSNVILDASYALIRPEVQSGDYVLLALSDTGSGMDANTKAHLFEPFFTTKTLGKGTGLGLATVYGIIKQSAGYIYAYSEPGHGATFKVYLPGVDEAADLPPEPVAARSLSGTETLLLVEDNVSIRTMSQLILTQNGYTVLQAGDGPEALQLARSHAGRIELLVTDVVMPGMSGSQLADQLTQTRPDTRVLYLSGYTDETVHRHGLLNSGLSFLQKPFTPSVLLHKVRQLLDSSPGP